MEYYRFYNLLSYWIYFWFVLYIKKIITINPLIIFISVFVLYDVIQFKLNFINPVPTEPDTPVRTLRYILAILMHLIPLIYLIITYKYNKANLEKEVLFTVILFIVYLFYLKCNNYTFFTIYDNNTNLTELSSKTMDEYINLRFFNKVIFAILIILKIYITYVIIKTLYKKYIKNK